MDIIILTIGRTGSTVLAQMLGQLGWNLPSDEYSEPAIIREINDRIIRGLYPDYDECYAAVEALPSPCVLKDPRFCMTLEHWKPFLEGSLLLWYTRDLQDVEISLRRANWGKDSPEGYTLRGETLVQLNQRCKLHFKEWNGPKLKLSQEQIKAAVSLFDLSRG